MITFWLECLEDKTGVSGVGKVAEGIIFTNGKVALCWLSEFSSIAIYDSVELVMKIHGHNGTTKLRTKRRPDEKE